MGKLAHPYPSLPLPKMTYALFPDLLSCSSRDGTRSSPSLSLLHVSEVIFYFSTENLDICFLFLSYRTKVVIKVVKEKTPKVEMGNKWKRRTFQKLPDCCAVIGGAGEAVSSQLWSELCLVSTQCIVGFNMVTPQLSHLRYSLVPSVELVPPGPVITGTQTLPVSRTMGIKSFLTQVSLGSSLDQALSPQLLGGLYTEFGLFLFLCTSSGLMFLWCPLVCDHHRGPMASHCSHKAQ